MPYLQNRRNQYQWDSATVRLSHYRALARAEASGQGRSPKGSTGLSPCLSKQVFTKELLSIHMNYYEFLNFEGIKCISCFFCSQHIFSVEHSHESKRLSLIFSTILASGVHWSRYDAGRVFAWARPSSLHESRSGAQMLLRHLMYKDDKRFFDFSERKNHEISLRDMTDSRTRLHALPQSHLDLLIFVFLFQSKIQRR